MLKSSGLESCETALVGALQVFSNFQPGKHRLEKMVLTEAELSDTVVSTSSR